jgi:hypothetical protein
MADRGKFPFKTESIYGGQARGVVKHPAWARRRRLVAVGNQQRHESCGWLMVGSDRTNHIDRQP